MDCKEIQPVHFKGYQSWVFFGRNDANVAKVETPILTARFRLKLKKLGKTTRPFRYDLNQIPYDYTVEVRNRFKGLDLIDIVPDEHAKS